MEVQEGGKCLIMEKILDVECQVTFDAVDPFGPVASLHFDWLIEVISHRFPSNNDDVAHSVEIESLVVDDFSPFTDWSSHFLVVKGEEPTYDWRQYQDEPHHDSIGVHIWGASLFVLCIMTARVCEPCLSKRSKNVQEVKGNGLHLTIVRDMWEQAPENTLESLRHAIGFHDGIEFDLRLTADGEVIIHHDADVSVPKSMLTSSKPWVEHYTLDELESFGFCSFRSLLEDATVREQWRDHGKMGCVELKRPHPKSDVGGGYFGFSSHKKHITTLINTADALLNEFEIPNQNTVYYAFHKGMKSSIEAASTQRPWAELLPYIPPFGTRQSKRLRALPHFLTHSFSRLVNHHRTSGASMIPAAIEYFVPPINKLPLGKKVGLSGKSALNLQAAQGGFPVYVWPTKPDIEHRLQAAGLTGLTDQADPNLTWLPSGHARWTRPATLPLDEEQRTTLENATKENHLDILKELNANVVPWMECDASSRASLMAMWSKRWQWQDLPSSIGLPDGHAEGSSPPWQAVRLIGHRGSGKTQRPVLQNHHSM